MAAYLKLMLPYGFLRSFPSASLRRRLHELLKEKGCFGQHPEGFCQPPKNHHNAIRNFLYSRRSDPARNCQWLHIGYIMRVTRQR